MSTHHALLNRRTLTVAALGFASGLPLALSDSTLQAWLVSAGIDVATIGLFSLVGLPYVLKFLWAPLLDRFQPGWPGRRRDWMLVSQLSLIVLLLLLAAAEFSPVPLPWWLGMGALLVAVLSATQDVAIDAYRTELLPEQERGFGAGVATTGYRLAMLVSGAGALLMADRFGFATVYALMAAVLTIGLVATMLGPELSRQEPPPASLRDAFAGPVREFFTREGAWALLLLVLLYKLGDAFAGRLAVTFLLRELEFSLTDVGAVYKGLGMLASIGGALYGGALMVRWGLYRSLLIFAWLQALTNLGFWVLAVTPASFLSMATVIGLENLTGGMGTSAFVALLMACCARRYTATQFALLTAVASLGRVFAGPPSGYLVEALGWPIFFALTFLVALPAVFFIIWRKAMIRDLTDTGA